MKVHLNRYPTSFIFYVKYRQMTNVSLLLWVNGQTATIYNFNNYFIIAFSTSILALELIPELPFLPLSLTFCPIANSFLL